MSALAVLYLVVFLYLIIHGENKDRAEAKLKK